MRLAYSISGYKDPAQFAWLIGAIADARDVFIIHVDAKSPPSIHQGFRDIAKACPNIHFIESEPIVWMGKGLVQAEFRAIAKAFQAAPDFDYLINLSAQDYPLTCREARVDRLAAAPGANHLALKPLDELPLHVRRRRFLYSFEWRERLIKTPLPRLKPPDLDISWKGSWWRVLTREVCGWLLTTAKREVYWRFLRQVQIPDELIMQNLIMDSPYRETVTGDNQHFILWPGRTGNPTTLRISDLPAIEASSKLFTRKLDHQIDRELMEHLAKRINAAVPTDRSIVHQNNTRTMAYGAARLRGVKRRLHGAEERLRTGLGQLMTRPGPHHGGLFEPKPFERQGYPVADEEACGLKAWQITPADGHYMHSFFDVPPISSDGRYLLASRIPFIWRLPAPGDAAELCLIDLYEQTIQTIYRSTGWGMQLGINAQWHPKSSRQVFCNDVIDGRPRAVLIDLDAKTYRPLDGPLYTVSPDGRYLYSPSLTRINHSQDGYGVPLSPFGVVPIKRGLNHDEGIWRTDTESGRTELLISIADLAAQLDDDPAVLRRAFTSLFHTKISPDGKRLFQVMRHVGLADRPGIVRSRLLSLDVDGGRIREPVPMTRWDWGGHHPNWCENSRQILMNLTPSPDEPIVFMRIDDETGMMECLAPGIRGSGHPSLRYGFIVTDCYHHEGFGGNKSLPLRLIDLETNLEHHPLHFFCGTPGMKARRIDPHPAWSPDGSKIIVNCMIGGHRQIVLIDVASLQARARTSQHQFSPKRILTASNARH